MENQNYFIIVQSLKLLAANFEDQVISLPNYVHCTDEIALIFDDAFRFLPLLKQENLISNEVYRNIIKLNDLLDKMSNDKTLWNLLSLKSDQSWINIRIMSRSILEMMNEQFEKPNLSYINWVKG